MEESKVVDINEDKIVITSSDLMTITNLMSPLHQAYNKLQSLTYVSGKLQYWVFKLTKKLNELHRDVDSVRVLLAKEYCIKNKRGELVFSDSQYKFTKENEEARQAEIDAAETPEKAKDPAFLEELNLKYCERDEDGDPIMVGGNNLSFNNEGMSVFQKAYGELMMAENVLNINRIKIDSATLEKMNASGKETLSVDDMTLLEKFFDFVE
jgi:hypothetical protein